MTLEKAPTPSPSPAAPISQYPPHHPPRRSSWVAFKKSFLDRWGYGGLFQSRMLADMTSARPYVRGWLLDIGCGVKPYGALFAPNMERYVGIERPETLSGSRRMEAYASGLSLPFRDASFDTVLCTQVLEHVPEPARLLEEAHRALKPGGHLVLTCPLMEATHEEPHDYFRFTRFGLHYLLSTTGFTVVTLRAQGGFWRMWGQNLTCYLWDVLEPKARWARIILTLGSAPIHVLFALLDRLSRDERYTMNYFVLAKKQGAS